MLPKMSPSRLNLWYLIINAPANVIPTKQYMESSIAEPRDKFIEFFVFLRIAFLNIRIDAGPVGRIADTNPIKKEIAKMFIDSIAIKLYKNF